MKAARSRWVYPVSLALAWLLPLIALPPGLAPLKPFWLALVAIYWALEEPERMTLGRAFLFGLVADLLGGALLGEQALRLVVVVYIVLRLRTRMRFFPMPQQTLAVLALLVNDRVVQWMIRAFSGEGAPDWIAWGAPLIGMLLWPFVFLLIDGARLRTRATEG